MSPNKKERSVRTLYTHQFTMKLRNKQINEQNKQKNNQSKKFLLTKHRQYSFRKKM